MNKDRLIRIGMVNYINTAPIYEVWKKRSHPDNYRIVEAPPATLNLMLASGELDLGFVSSYEYGVRPEAYQLLPGLSISANGSVGSVFLFCRVAQQDLDKKTILLSSQSETSIALVRIILENFYQVRPNYVVGDVNGAIAAECAAVLAIGDDALRLASDGSFQQRLDLGEVWARHTKLPFVFAICAVRDSFCREYANEVRAIQNEFISCRQEGRKNLDTICVQVAPRIPMHPDECYVYLHAIEHDLDGRKIEALEHYYRFLIERGEISPNSVPLKFFDQ